MRIRATEQFKSIKPFEPIELKPLSVVTGTNGSGKSQLLAGLENGAIHCDLLSAIPTPADIDEFQKLPPNAVLLLRNGSLGEVASDEEYQSQIGRYFEKKPPSTDHIPHVGNPRVLRNNLLSSLNRELEQIIEPLLSESLKGADQAWLLGPSDLSDLVLEKTGNDRRIIIENLFARAEECLAPRRARDINDGEARYLSLVNTVADGLGILRAQVDHKTLMGFQANGGFGIFGSDLLRMIGLYRDLEYGNELARIDKDRGMDRSPLSKSEFVSKYGQSPASLISRLLKAVGLPYFIEEPPIDISEPATLTIMHDLDPTLALKFKDLSSGEQILFRFALSIARPKPRFARIEFPKLLLLDEVDASLHPEMVQRWLKAIKEGLVDELGIHVVLTTHSPTTVALAPNDAIYLMDGGRIEPTTKQAAINRLTVGVPTLSIDFSGRRQVFCESDTDADIFETIYANVKPRLSLHKELNFIGTGIRTKSRVIPAGSDLEINSGCAVVLETVQKLNDSGARNVYGIIDWDTTASPQGNIFVLGEGTHRTIENILLDPLLVGALMVLEGLPGVKTDIGRRGFESLAAGDLQRLSDAVVDAVGIDLETSETTVVTYLGGTSICLPNCWALMKKDDLLAMIAERIPELKRRYWSKRGGLAKQICKTVISEHPEYCPSAISDLFNAISCAQDS